MISLSSLWSGVKTIATT